MMTEFKMTDEQLQVLYEACKVGPVMEIGDCASETIADRNKRAMAAWNKLGDEMGFYALSVVPVPGKDDHYFMAEPKPKSDDVELGKVQS